MPRNIVPLYVDKDSGQIIATNNGVTGGGGNTGGGGGELLVGAAFGYVHNQTSLSNQWIVIHDKNTQAVIYQIYTDTMEHVIPDDVVIDNANQLTINLSYPMTGIAHLILFQTQ